jgi:hypothetical protein
MNPAKQRPTKVACGMSWWKGGAHLRCLGCGSVSSLDAADWDLAMRSGAAIACGGCGGEFAGLSRLRVLRD